MAARKIDSTYDSRCSADNCSTMIKIGQPCWYDALKPRGMRTRCLAHPFEAETVTAHDKAEAELAALKAKLKAVEEAEKQAEPKPVVSTTAQTDPLAQAIAKAVEPLIAGKLDETRVRDIAARMIADYMTPAANTITVVSPACPEGKDMGRQHKQFAELLAACNARTKNGRLNVWLAGSAGTGKTTAAQKVAEALGLAFCTMPTQTDTYGFYGYIRPGDGQYQRTPARDIWENGGVLVLDDFDGTPPDVAIQFNAPFANGHCTFPDGVVARHPDCVIILTANTWGYGATNEYVGRMKQDAAFLDRFVTIDWQIDEELERDTCPDASWVKRVQAIRAKVREKGLKVLVTPRASYYGAALIQAGYTVAMAEKATLRKAMTDDQWRSVC